MKKELTGEDISNTNIIHIKTDDKTIELFDFLEKNCDIFQKHGILNIKDMSTMNIDEMSSKMDYDAKKLEVIKDMAIREMSYMSEVNALFEKINK